jgi:hypothetical protein
MIEKIGVIMDLPNCNTLEIIEERKKFLVKKNQKYTNKNGYILAEIGALDRIINLIKIVQKNSDLGIRIAEENLLENNGHEESNDNEDEILYSYEREINKNSKLDITFLQNNGNKYIIVGLKKYKKSFLKWNYQGKVKFTPDILEEILNKGYEIGII